MTDALGPISLAEQHLRTALADSSTFREWVSASTQEQALSHIYVSALPDPQFGREHTRDELESYRPFAIVFAEENGPGFSATKIASECYDNEGILWIFLEMDVPREIAISAAEIDIRMKNAVGSIIMDLLDLSETAGYLAINRAVMWGMDRSDHKEIPTIRGCGNRVGTHRMERLSQ